MSDLILYAGPVGMLRASHREIDHSKSIHPQYPFHTHEREQKIPKALLSSLRLIDGLGVEYEAGESLQVQVLSGNYCGI